MMNRTSYQRAGDTTDEWYTPAWITDALGRFDLDPCEPVSPVRRIADRGYSADDDGLAHEWTGRVWLNPPYSNVEPFILKMAEHGDGIALLFNRQDTRVWQDVIFPTADAFLFLRGRVRFVARDGSLRAGGTCGSVLIAWGDENVRALEDSGIDGWILYNRRKERRQ